MRYVYIAGAGSRGVTMAKYLTYLDNDVEIKAYLYDNDEKNPTEIEGVPVLDISKKVYLNNEYPVYIATRGVNQEKLKNSLKLYGIKKIIPVDVQLDMKFRNAFIEKYYRSIGKQYSKISYNQNEDSRDDTGYTGCIYVASSAFDGELKEKYEKEEYEKVIQVGTALTSQTINADYFDNEGCNISDKNKQYCELTGLYWIWKHAKEDYIGLAHYRRHFLLTQNWFDIVKNQKIYVILPVPLYVSPSLAENYCDRHIAKDWDRLMEYVYRNNNSEYEKMNLFFKGNLYSPCNMIIAKREIICEFCEWLFPILDTVVKSVGEHKDLYQNRYPGFMAERLMTYYFETKSEKYHIVYADKSFLC